MDFNLFNYKHDFEKNTNFGFPNDPETQYLTSSTGEKLPYKLFSASHSYTNAHILREPNYQDTSRDFNLVERQFSLNKQLSFTSGTKIQSINDIAWLFRALEDEAVEHTFILYRFKDDSYLVQHLSTGGITGTVVDLRLVVGNAFALNPKSITLVHNHPSGKLISSVEDRKMLKKIIEIFKESNIRVERGIIINLRSGKYLEFGEGKSEDLTIWKNEQNQDQKNVNVYSFNKQVFVENYQPKKITNCQDVAQFLSTQKFGISDKTETLILNNANEIVGKFILPQEKQYDKLVELLTIYGGTSSILFGNNVSHELIERYNKKLELIGFNILDGIRLQSGNYYSILSEAEIHMKKPIASIMNSRLEEEFNDHLPKISEENFNKSNLQLFNENKLLEIEIPQERKGDFFDIKVSKEEAEWLIRNEIIVDVMCQEYGEDEEWVGMTIDDFDEKTEKFDNDYQTFEISTVENSPKQISEIIYYLENFKLNNTSKEFLENHKYTSLMQRPSERFSEELDAISPGFNLEDTINDEMYHSKEYSDTIHGNQHNINPQNKIIMEKQEKTPLENLKTQLKYHGFGESEKLHQDLENAMKLEEKNFTLQTKSDKTLPGNEVEFILKFGRSDEGKVYFNSYNATLKNEKEETFSHNFSANKENSFTAKEAVNLLEGRAVKTQFINPTTDENEPAFVKLNFGEEKTDYGNYKIEVYNKNYGVDVAQIVDKSNLIFEKPEYKDNIIKSLEKGNIVKVKFSHDDQIIEGKVVLNPQYKSLNLYDNDMNRLNTNKPSLNVDDSQKLEKGNAREHSASRGI
ncbi:JAB domain-containing protein [Cloacibacterium normanense]|uniref:JAB domain-containing protein n=1 Tax=Cloacibacterium normanense TaxID=237258 RepID=UPI00391D6F3C